MILAHMSAYLPMCSLYVPAKARYVAVLTKIQTKTAGLILDCLMPLALRSNFVRVKSRAHAWDGNVFNEHVEATNSPHYIASREGNSCLCTTCLLLCCCGGFCLLCTVTE